MCHNGHPYSIIGPVRLIKQQKTDIITSVLKPDFPRISRIHKLLDAFVVFYQ